MGYLNLDIQMGDPVGTIMRELTDPAYRGVTQASVAITYACIMAQLGDEADYATINAAIRARWKSGFVALDRIKKLAWRHLEEWASKRQMPHVEQEEK